MGLHDDVTLGEISRACKRIETKVDDQGEAITSINLRLTTIEAQRPPGNGRMLGVGGLGAGLAVAVDWVVTHFSKGGGGTP